MITGDFILTVIVMKRGLQTGALMVTAKASSITGLYGNLRKAQIPIQPLP